MVSTKSSLPKRLADVLGVNAKFHKIEDDFFDPSLEYIASPAEAELKYYGDIGDGGYILSKHDRIIALENMIGRYADRFQDGIYLNMYLHWKNKHYFKFPYDGTVEYIQINDPKKIIPALIGRDNIFSGQKGLSKATKQNANIGMIINAGKFSYAMIAVGSFNVNHVTVGCEVGKKYHKGDDAGYFSVGSTILLCFDKSFKENSELLIRNGKKKDIGENIIKIKSIYEP